MQAPGLASTPSPSRRGEGPKPSTRSRSETKHLTSAHCRLTES